MHTALCNVLCVCLYTGGGEIIANITKNNMQRERKEEKEKREWGLCAAKKKEGWELMAILAVTELLLRKENRDYRFLYCT